MVELTILLPTLVILGVGAINQPHLGCYKEDKENRELAEEVWTNRTDSSNLNVTNCIVTCQLRGFPYAGLGLGATECWCGSSYGRYGTSEDCVYVCFGHPGYKCGGSEEYNIYYTVQQVPDCPADTHLITRQPYDVCLSVPETRSYSHQEARRLCLLRNQDLLALTTDSTVSTVDDLLTNSTIGKSSTWVGLTRPKTTDPFMWTSAHEETYSSSDVDGFWREGHPTNEHLCVAYSNGKLETGSCTSEKTVICQTTLDKTSIIIHKSFGDRLAEFFSDKGNLALVVIVTLIVMTVIGCCVVYRLHKKSRERQVEGRPKLNFT